jgi:hypothetical protein
MALSYKITGGDRGDAGAPRVQELAFNLPDSPEKAAHAAVVAGAVNHLYAHARAMHEELIRRQQAQQGRRFASISTAELAVRAAKEAEDQLSPAEQPSAQSDADAEQTARQYAAYEALLRARAGV